MTAAMKNIYVGNLPYTATDDELRTLFSEHGEVTRASVVMDRETGRSKGFGFIEMSNDDEAMAAIEKLNGYSLGGRALSVNEARPREDRGGAGGSRGGGGGGGGGYRGGGGGGGSRGGGGGGRGGW